MRDPLEAPSTKPTITIDDFARVEIRVGKVITAEHIEGSDKLIKLQVDFGPVKSGDHGASPETRQILSGIKKSYSPESLVGKSFMFVTNLAPREMMGLTSNGMLLAVSDQEGLPVLYTFDKEIAPGTRVK
ncbi:MAG: methionine--tRNA ligase subunit beta [Patescibacteria group bacterium]